MLDRKMEIRSPNTDSAIETCFKKKAIANYSNLAKLATCKAGNKCAMWF